MKRQLLLLTLLCAAATAHAGEGQVYKWTDAAGIVHYSDAPPPRDTQNVQTVRVTGGDRPHAVASAADNTEAPDKKPEAAAGAGTPPATDATFADTPENRAKNCQQARANLDVLQSKYPVSVTGADGKATALDDKARQARIDAANAQVAQNCKE